MPRTRRIRLLCWVTWVLPVLLLRAAIPAGFMAASVDGVPEIVLCQPGMMAGGHHHHHHGSPGSDPSEMDPTCPYAQSAGPALIPTPAAWPAVVLIQRSATSTPDTQAQFGSGPPRRQYPRGPPLV